MPSSSKVGPPYSEIPAVQQQRLRERPQDGLEALECADSVSGSVDGSVSGSMRYEVGSQHDIVLLCPNPNPGSKSVVAQRRKAIAARCRFVGLNVTIERSRDDDEKLILLSAPEELLEEIAERITMEKRLKMVLGAKPALLTSKTVTFYV